MVEEYQWVEQCQVGAMSSVQSGSESLYNPRTKSSSNVIGCNGSVPNRLIARNIHGRLQVSGKRPEFSYQIILYCSKYNK
jgi:hypothetical protein